MDFAVARGSFKRILQSYTFGLYTDPIRLLLIQLFYVVPIQIAPDPAVVTIQTAGKLLVYHVLPVSGHPGRGESC